MTRALHAVPVHWEIVEAERRAPAEPYRLEWAIELPLEPRPIRGRVSLAMTADPERGVAHFVAQAVLREVSA